MADQLPPPVRKGADGRIILVRDAAMELGALEAVEAFLSSGERLDTTAKELANNHCAYQQIVNVLMDWLEELGDKPQVEEGEILSSDEDRPKKVGGRQKQAVKGKKGKKKAKEEVEEKKEAPKDEPSSSKASEPSMPAPLPLAPKALTVRTAFGDSKITDKRQVWSSWQWLANANAYNSGKELPPVRRDSSMLMSPPNRRDSTGGGLLSPTGVRRDVNFLWTGRNAPSRRRTFSKSVDECDVDKDDKKKEVVAEKEVFDGREEAEKCVENTLANTMMKIFDQTVADNLFEGGGGIDWLPDLIKHKRWRQLLYDLIETYPNCLMLNFAVKLISDAGYQDEISNASVNLACGQLDIFTKVFVSTFDKVLKEHRHGCRSVAYEKAFGYLVSIVCQNEHTYVLVQCALTYLYKTLIGRKRAACRQVAEELRAALKDKEFEAHCLMYSLMLSDDYIPDEILTASLNMVSKNELNPADIKHLYDDYITPRPVSIDVVRDFTLIELLIDALFHCDGPKVSLEHRDMYIYLLSYVASVAESGGERFKTTQACGDFAATREALTTVVAILEASDDLTRDVNVLDMADRPVIAMGILYYVHTMLMSENTLGELPLVCLCMLDQLGSKHHKLRSKTFRICQQLFNKVSNSPEAAEVIMDRQKLVLDRLVHLFSEGEVVCVLEKVAAWFLNGEIDVSLVRYFVSEVLDIIAPPYSDILVSYMLPLVDDLEIFDEAARERNSAVVEFLRTCGRLEEDQLPAEKTKEKEKPAEKEKAKDKEAPREKPKEKGRGRH